MHFTFPILLTLLALIPARQALALGDQLECQVKEDDLKHTFAGEPEHYCHQRDRSDVACWNLLRLMSALSVQLREIKEKNCEKMVEAGQRAQQVSGQLDAIERNLGTYSSLLAQYNHFGEQLKIAIKKVEEQIKPVLVPHDHAIKPEPRNITGERTDIERALKGQKRWEDFLVPNTPDVKEAGNSKNHFAARHGVSFIKTLKLAEKQNNADRAKIQSDITQLEHNREAMNKLRSPQPPPTAGQTQRPPTAADGLNMNTLMGLATAGMGLASMMKQQQAAQDQGLPQATSPTPASTNPASAQKPAPSISKLDDGKSKFSNMVAAAPATNPETPASAGPAGVPNGDGLHADSDISAAAPTAPIAPAASKAPGGGGTGGSGGDSGGPAQREISAAASEAHKEDEALQGIGNGGLGGGPGGSSGGSMPASSGSGDPAVAAAEDGMKDLLNEMKDTVEGNTDGGDAQSAEGEIMEMNAEDLFPRVHAAHVRSLKRGRVLNGLGEKISQDPE